MKIAKVVKDVYVVAAKRTPFGSMGGRLSRHTATDLQEVAARAAMEEGGVQPDMFTSQVLSNCITSSPEGIYHQRTVGARLGIPHSTTVMEVNRFCGSGFQAVITAAQEMELGLSDLVLTGGAENMTNAPYMLFGNRQGTKFGSDLKLHDMLWAGLVDHFIGQPMGITAENVAEKYKLERAAVDEAAFQSHQRWKTAQDNGVFDAEITPVTVKGKKGPESMSQDEHPKPQVSYEKIAKLPPAFKKGGIVTAANSSGICDGGASVILASEAAMKRHNLTPIARLAAYSVIGCDPYTMGMGPLYAIEALLEAAGKGVQDIDHAEINEAFATQYVACRDELGLDPAKTNPHGGAISIGHPISASGQRITAHLAHSLRRTGGKLGVGSACIGGGQGIAVLLENVN